MGTCTFVGKRERSDPDRYASAGQTAETAAAIVWRRLANSALSGRSSADVHHKPSLLGSNSFFREGPGACACLILSLLFVAASSALGQTATLRGQVFDQTGAVVPQASIVLTDSHGKTTAGASSNEGSYSFSGLAPGKYMVQAFTPDLAQGPVLIDLKAGVLVLKLELKVRATQQELRVQENPGPVLSTDSSANASSLVLSGKDLNALADDPEDMSADLQALAGPAAGPDGSAMYIDGFSGGQLPPKDAIREIRINQNPFSPEYDKLGYGRVDILTKPGTGKLHGGGYFNFGDSVWNSRNPYAAEKAPFLLREYGATLGGPLELRNPASFFVAFDGAAIDNGAIINGSVLDPSTFTIVDPYTEVFTIPQQRIRVNPRVDDRLTTNDTISMRYEIADADIRHSGVGSFDLDSTGVHNHGTDQTVQFSNMLTLGSNGLNETRLQYYRANISNRSENPAAQLDVLNAFTGGGAQVGNSLNTLNSWEWQNYATIDHQKHTVRGGARVRAATIDNTSPINFGGTFTFAGRTAPELDSRDQPVLGPSGQPVLTTISSIEAYRRTLRFQNAGLSASQVRVLGGGASQFTTTAGNPSRSVDQEDIGLFVGETWRARPNLTIDAGLRYEWQTNLHEKGDFAPRLGLAWAPGFRSGASPRTILRAGFGLFYQRFDIVNVLTAERYSGSLQQSWVVANPDFFPSIPPPTALVASQQTVERLSPTLSAPYLMETAAGVERQLPARTTVALTYVHSHGGREFLTIDVNTPLSGTYNPQVPGSGTYPLGVPNPVFLVESSGVYDQNELITNVNSKAGSAVSLFASYLYNHAMSDTDYSSPPQNTDFNPAIAIQGLGVGSFPANPWHLTGEYGPASTDIHHQLNVGGTLELKGGLRLSPLLVADSGPPFNITVGQDLYGTTLFNGRPGIATDPNRPGLVETKYGLLDPNPTVDESILGRNFGRGPGIFMLNLRVSEVFSFGPAAEGSVSAGGRRPETGPFGGNQGQSTVRTGHRFSLAVSLAVRNLLNHNNPGPIIGDITSSLFGRANQPFGVGSLGGTGFSESANNRRLEFQTRLTF